MDLLPASFQKALPPFVIAWLKQQQDHLVSYERRVRELVKAAEILKKERYRVECKVDEEENRYGKEVNVEVKNWLKVADNILSEFENFNKNEDHEYAGFSYGFLPKPGIRYRLSKTASHITRKVNGLLQTTKHDNFSYWLGPPSMDAVFSNIGYESFASRNETMDKIMATLEDSSVRMIGVHGLSGVGKTTLAKEIAKKALEAKLFNVVIMTNVSRNPSIRKIQGQFADMLGMKLEEESEIGRAARIRKRLMNEKENILIILDDLWAKLGFITLGIPSENDDDGKKNLKEGKYPVANDALKTEKNDGASGMIKAVNPLRHYKRCKVLLISETKQVLFDQMDGKGSSIFSLEVLKEKEAVMLFKKIAGVGDDSSEFQKLAVQIANKCKGLPMAVVTTARALKNENLPVWEDVHRQLERQKLTGTPEFSTKLSYDLLENEELKNIFLLCARIGHDALIMDLVKYCIGLGFLQDVYTVREARDRVQLLVARLKESSLLSDSYSGNLFTMQDIVRGAALSIESKEKHAFTVIKGKLDEWPDEDKLERYTAISFLLCDIIEEFPESINCPRLRVFHVDNNDPSLKVPANFFTEMRELRVLILTGIDFSPLPPSIQCLTKLKMLCLEQCKLGNELSIIGKLKKLRILSLSGSDIEKLPVELKHLAKLQLLDISNCSKLRVIPPDVISSLTSLEVLYMRNSSIQWMVEEHGKLRETSSLSELRHLNKLETIDIQIPNVSHLPKNLFFDKLDNYKIVVGDLNEYSVPDFKIPEKYEASRFLAVQIKDGFNIHSQKGIKMLFDRVENLLLGELNGVQDIFYELNLEGFPHLKHFSIVSNSDIKSLIDSKDRQHPEKAFPKLESLYLYKLKILEQICSSQLTDASFRKLKIVKIKICGQLKNVFFFTMVKLLTALETIEVSECHSLKAIVVAETQSTTNKIVFPELRSLTLQSLSELIGFYTISQSTEEQVPNCNFKELFDEKVEAPKLERLELSSVKILNIWSDHPLSSSYFQNLIHLDVNDCRSLKYLLSLKMAKSLVKLQSLFVSECEMMESIFKQEVSKDIIFPKLKNVKLSRMNRLRKIWQSQVSSDSFAKLETLTIEECGKLDNVFPCEMLGKFRCLCNLRVANCKSIEVIFDLKVIDNRKRDVGKLTYLQNIHLEALPELKYVWNKDFEGFVKFENLQKIWVRKCPILKNIFPVSVAKSLKKLEYLKVWDCRQLKEIVAMEESVNRNMISISFQFPNLTSVVFWGLPKLKCFYRGGHTLSWSALTDLSVKFCDKLEPFRTISAGPEKMAIILPKEVIFNLKCLELVSRDAKWLRSTIGNYRMHKLEEFRISRLVDTEILYFFLHRNPNLKSLVLHICFFEELVPQEMVHANENSGVVPKLKSLRLLNLPLLKMIGFERDPVLQRIESLILDQCPSLITIVPSSVSFTYLSNLKVSNCHGLINLMSPPTAKSLGQITTMKVIRCDMLKEIVSEQGYEDNKSAKIVFRQLKALELSNLKNLTSFSSSKSCEFEFPSLEKFVVTGCPKMQKFSEEAKSTPILRQISFHRKDNQKWCWEGDLNATIEKIFTNKLFYEGTDTATVFNSPFNLQALHREIGLHEYSFHSLQTLKMESCNSDQPHAIASNVLPYLKNLNELEVRNCSNINVIFEISDTDKIKGTTFLLKKLTLDGLPDLIQVWDNCNFAGILSFQNLQQVHVTDCKSLKTLFPGNLAKRLMKLEKLDVSYCAELLEIVGKEEAAAAEAIEESLLPCLTRLNLFMLPKLNYFCPKRFTLECPELNHLEVQFCGKLELFQSQQEAHPEGQGSSTPANRKPLFSAQEVISKLEALTLNWKHTKMLSDGQFSEDILLKLNKLRLCFEDVKGNGMRNGMPTLPIEFLKKAPKLEYLQVSHFRGLKEIFPSQTCEIAKESLLGHLKTLCLRKLMELESIGLEYFLLTRPCEITKTIKKKCICEKLRHLIVISCPRLAKLVDVAVSFSNLKQLIIRDCDRLEYLFTSSTAKTLVYLEEMKIEKCESVKAILEKAHDEKTSDVINFEHLSEITLNSLSSLVCFYSGNFTLQFPYLRKVVMLECRKMKTFSQGLIHAQSLSGIQVSLGTNDDLVFHNDLNATVEWLRFLQQERLVLDDYPHKPKKLWLGEMTVPGWCFSSLKSLVVKGCEFLSNAILPCHVLPFLCNMEELMVRDCSSIEAIFHVKDTPGQHTKMGSNGPASSLSIPLKKLTLEQLPMLKHIWNEDPKESLHLPYLEEVLVDQCGSIQSLFPASVSKDRLQKIDVKNCKGLVEIVGKDETSTAEGANKLLTMFPSLTFLKLSILENLKYIYPGMHHLEWPQLKELNVYHCPKLMIFTTGVQNYPNSDLDGQNCFPTKQHALVSAEKVPPHLDQLSLSKEEAMMIEQGRLHVDLQKIKFLDMQCFHHEPDIFPYIFFSKVALPSIENLAVGCSVFKEIFPSQRPDMECTKILSQLKLLHLNYLPMLNSIGLEHSWVRPFCENVESLVIYRCCCLENLVPLPYSVSFLHLAQLTVKECREMKYLFTSSTARSLCLLNEMHISNCKSMREIVAIQGEEPEEDEIMFGQLRILTLVKLDLVAFYAGNSTLKFPSLGEMWLTECYNMEIFCHSYVVPEDLQLEINGGRPACDLNTAIKQQFEEGITDSQDF